MTRNFTIRPARSAEKRELEELQRRASLANPEDRASILAHPEAIDLPAVQIAAGQAFVAESGGVLLGFHVVLPRDDGQAELDGLFVDPSLWRSGVGRGLVEHAAEYSRDQGATILHVIGNPHARGFYLAVGFVITGEFQTQFGPGLLMELKL